MFRALLWKEWRELWVLPAVAAPLGVASLFITKAATQTPVQMLPNSSFALSPPLSPVVWDTSFAPWLLLAALYIPTHLYARERDLNTVEFLSAMPLDRFRLWWYRLLIGISAMAGVGITLAAIIIILKTFYKTQPDFFPYGVHIILASYCVAAILFSLSAFFSSVFRRQFSAITGIVITFLCFGAIYWTVHKISTITSLVDFYPQPFTIVTLWGRFSTPNAIDSITTGMLILCPSLLFVSLAAFARGNMAQSSRRRVALTYGLLAVVVLSPVSMGFHYFFAGVKSSRLEWSDDIRFWYVSPDWQYIAMQPFRTARSMTRYGPLLVLDLSRNRINTMENNLLFPNPEMTAHFPITDNGSKRVYVYKSFRNEKPNMFPFTIDVIDPDGSHKINIFTGRWFDSGDESAFRFIANLMGSLDGKYMGLVKEPSRIWNEDGYIKIMDASGKVLGTYPIPLNEKGEIYLAGWDYASRLYFCTYYKEPRYEIVVRRMSVEHMVPEEVPNIPTDILGYSFMSPNGRWILFSSPYDPDGGMKCWLYDIEKETYKFLANTVRGFHWSPDGRTLAYPVQTFPPPESKTDWPRPIRYLKLFVYDIQTGERQAVLDGSMYGLGSVQWSPSGAYLLFGYQDYIAKDQTPDKPVSMLPGTMELKLWSVETGKITAVTEPIEPSVRNRAEVYWIAGDRLVWRNRYFSPLDRDSISRTVLIVTEKDGSNPQELFRIEDGKYYLYGKEQG